MIRKKYYVTMNQIKYILMMKKIIKKMMIKMKILNNQKKIKQKII